MRYRLRDIPFLLRSKQGRRSLAAGQAARFWPLLRLFTALYRRTILRKLHVIAVAGSLGKTTTARAVATAMECRMPDGVSNRKEMLARDLLGFSARDKTAVLEVAVAGPGNMKSQARMVKPDIVIVTSIASEHLLTFKTLENTRKEKSEIVKQLGPGQTVILNADDPHVMWMAGQTSARIVSCGFSDSADIRATSPLFTNDGRMTLDLIIGQESWPVNFPVPGKHMVFPLLAATAVARAEGREIGKTVAKLERIQPVDGRMQPVRLASGALLLRDDFKSNRESVWQALDTLGQIPAKRRVLVLGGVSEISNRDRYDYYRELGRRIAAAADQAILCLQKNSFRRCRNEAVAAGFNPENINRISGDPLSALPLLPPDLKEGDLILVKGRSENRFSRLSLYLIGKQVECRLERCRLAVDCQDCELLGQKYQSHPLLGPNRSLKGS